MKGQYWSIRAGLAHVKIQNGNAGWAFQHIDERRKVRQKTLWYELFLLLHPASLLTSDSIGKDIARFRGDAGRDNNDSPAHIDFFGCNQIRNTQECTDNSEELPKTVATQSGSSKRKRGITDEVDNNSEYEIKSDSDDETFVGMFANSTKTNSNREKDGKTRGSDRGSEAAVQTKSQAAHAEQVSRSSTRHRFQLCSGSRLRLYVRSPREMYGIPAAKQRHMKPEPKVTSQLVLEGAEPKRPRAASAGGGVSEADAHQGGRRRGAGPGGVLCGAGARAGDGAVAAARRGGGRLDRAHANTDAGARDGPLVSFLPSSPPPSILHTRVRAHARAHTPFPPSSLCTHAVLLARHHLLPSSS